jgi:hypothetical protein
MSDMGYYGEMAARHMRRWQPTTYTSIPPPERASYFRALDDKVGQAIREREHSLTPPGDLQATDHAECVARLQMAHLMAEESVLAEMVLLAPEPGLTYEAEESQTDPNGTYLDPGWRSPRIELDDPEWQERQAEQDWKPLTK